MFCEVDLSILNKQTKANTSASLTEVSQPSMIEPHLDHLQRVKSLSKYEIQYGKGV
jgi:hypothetical protein